MVNFHGYVGGHSGEYLDYTISSILWIYLPTPTRVYYVSGAGIVLTNPASILLMGGIWLPNVMFALLTISYIREEKSRQRAYAVGLLALLYQMALGIYMMGYGWMAYHILQYFGPIPIQFIVGFLFLQYHGLDESKPLWDTDKKEWWEKADAEEGS